MVDDRYIRRGDPGGAGAAGFPRLAGARAGSGVFQMIPSSTLGAGNELAVEHSSLESEIELMKRLSISSGRPLTFTLF